MIGGQIKLEKINLRHTLPRHSNIVQILPKSLNPLQKDVACFGEGDDSFRRFAGGKFEGGDGVGSERAADGGLDTTTETCTGVECTAGGAAGGGAGVAGALLLVGAAADAALPDRR